MSLRHKCWLHFCALGLEWRSPLHHKATTSTLFWWTTIYTVQYGQFMVPTTCKEHAKALHESPYFIPVKYKYVVHFSYWIHPIKESNVAPSSAFPSCRGSIIKCKHERAFMFRSPSVWITHQVISMHPCVFAGFYQRHVCKHSLLSALSSTRSAFSCEVLADCDSELHSTNESEVDFDL